MRNLYIQEEFQLLIGNKEVRERKVKENQFTESTEKIRKSSNVTHELKIMSSDILNIGMKLVQSVINICSSVEVE